MFHRIHALLTIALAASLLVSTIVVQGQKLDPPYLSEMPTPTRVLSEIKGKDPEDTVERQMGAFMILDKIIEDLAYGLEHRPYVRLKPDEMRMQKAYNDAFTQLYAVIKRADHKYDHDRDLFNEVLAKLFSPSFRDLYFQADKKGGEFNRANFQKMYGNQSGAGAGNASGEDAHSLCAAKGLDDFTCMMQTMMKTIVNVADSTSAPIKPGLSLNGAYRAAKFQVALGPDRTFTMTCGGVVRLSNYTIETKNNQIFVSVKNDQDSFAFRLQPDGRTLVGPGQVSIHGYAPGGSRAVTTTLPGSSQQVTKTTQRELTPLEAQQYPDAVKNGQTYTVTETTTSTESTAPTTTTTTTPAYHASSAACTIGTLAPVVQTSAPSQPSFIDKIMPPSGDIPDGLRMAGAYDGPGGASIQFEPDKAIVGCHATIAERPYNVSIRGGQILINIGENGSSQLYRLTPEGVLAGDGSTTTLIGKRQTGQDALNDPTYVGSSDTCTYGNLTPRGQSQTFGWHSDEQRYNRTCWTTFSQ